MFLGFIDCSFESECPARNHITREPHHQLLLLAPRFSPTAKTRVKAALQALVLAQAVPLGNGLPGVVTHLPPVLHPGRRDAVRAQDQPPHHLVLGGAVEVDDQELDADVGQQIHGDVVDEGLVEDWVQSALLHVSLLLGDALPAVVNVHLHVGICGRTETKGPITQPLEAPGGAAPWTGPSSREWCGFWLLAPLLGWFLLAEVTAGRAGAVSMGRGAGGEQAAWKWWWELPGELRAGLGPAHL